MPQLKSQSAQSSCTCGHLRFEHYHKMTTPAVSDYEVIRTFSECAIKGCSCIKFATPPRIRKPRPIATLDRTEPRLFSV